jgi:hypothetical protein
MDIAGCGKSSIALLIAMRASHDRSISCKPVYRIDVKGPRNGSHLLYCARRTIAARILYRYDRKTRSAHIGHPTRGRLLSISGSLVHKRQRPARTQAMDLWKLHPTPALSLQRAFLLCPVYLLRSISTWNRRLSRFDDTRDTRARERIVPRACFFRTFDYPDVG